MKVVIALATAASIQFTDVSYADDFTIYGMSQYETDAFVIGFATGIYYTALLNSNGKSGGIAFCFKNPINRRDVVEAMRSTFSGSIEERFVSAAITEYLIKNNKCDG